MQQDSVSREGDSLPDRERGEPCESGVPKGRRPKSWTRSRTTCTIGSGEGGDIDLDDGLLLGHSVMLRLPVARVLDRLQALRILGAAAPPPSHHPRVASNTHSSGGISGSLSTTTYTSHAETREPSSRASFQMLRAYDPKRTPSASSRTPNPS